MTTTMEYATDDRNRLSAITDSVGNKTIYLYDKQTNVLQSVQYPGDTPEDLETDAREGTAICYDYDDMYRQIFVSAVAAEDASVIAGEPILFADYDYNDKDQLTAITTGSTTYNFTYGVFSLRSNVKVGSTTLATYNYTNDQNKYLQSLAYSNGDSIQYEYDKYGRVTKQTYEDGDTVTYQYDNDGALASVYDSATGITTKSYYDFTGRTGATELRKDNNLIFRVSGNFDEYGRLTSQSRQYTSQSFTDTYTYNPNGTLQGMVLGNLRGIGFTYDGFDRITAMNTGDDGVNGRTFTYRVADAEGTQTTSQIAELKYDEIANKPNKSALIFSYEYDNRGNIEKYTAPGEDKVKYIYDTQNQLISVRKDADNSILYSYTYDDAGNITQAVKNGTTYTYSYGNSNWGDLLTAYNGTAITYDTIGNPTSYYNGWSFTWEHGREMATATNGTQSLSFTYGYDGLRTTKTVNGVVYTYYYSGGKLMRLAYTGNTLDFFYDQNGTPFMLLHNSNIYYYITNAQGDVIRLVDINGNTAASYRYDPYGKAISALGSHATINPLRYRGYVFDHETGLYYLQSRYYDPEIGRFINADSLVSTGQGLVSNNMFAYCLNNPTNSADPSGYISKSNNPQFMIRGVFEGGGPIILQNKYAKTSGKIYGQGKFPNAHEGMGLGTYANNGCGVIAIYNAMQLLGKPCSLGSIEDDIFLCGGMLAGGLLGIEPWAVGVYFAQQNVNCTFYVSYSDLSQQIYEGAIVVFMAKINIDGRFHGCHYMAAQYINGEYIIYNLFNNSVTPKHSDTLAVVRNTTWICGYIVGGS